MRSARPACLGALALVLWVTSCTDDRERPSPFAPARTAQLSVELVAPRTNQTVIAGRSLLIRVRGEEPSGLLSEVGFYAHRIGPGLPLVDSGFVSVMAVTDTTVAFSYVVPDTFPNNAQLELVGVAGGQGVERARSTPHGVVIIHCTAGATFC